MFSSVCRFFNSLDISLSPPKVQECGPLNYFPSELIRKILSEVPISFDKNTSLVCKGWNELVKDLPDCELKYFGEKEWETYFPFKVEEDIPKLPLNIYEISRIMRKCLGGREDSLTCSLCLMPKGMSLNLLEELAQNCQQENKPKFHPYACSKAVFKYFGDQKVEKSYWILITNDVFKRGKIFFNLSYDKAMKLPTTVGGQYCKPPRLLEMAVCCFMHYIHKGDYAFPRYNFLIQGMAYCEEKMSEKAILVAGHKDPFAGLRIAAEAEDRECNSTNGSGIGACQRFF